MTLYYVGKDGNDSWNGLTRNSAFLTISKGVSELGAGDRLEIGEGTYVEQILGTASGTAQNPIQIYGVGEVVIDGEADVNGLNTGLPEGAWGPFSSLSGKQFKYTPLVYMKGNYIEIDNITIKRSLGRGIQLGGGTRIEGCKLTNITTMVTRASGGYIYYNDDITIGNCVFTGAADLISEYDTAPNHAAAMSFRSCHGVHVYDTEAYENWGEGFMIDSNFGNSSDFLFERCKSYNNGWVDYYIHAAIRGIVRDCSFWQSDDWNPEGDTRWSNTQGVTIRVIEKHSYDMGGRNFTKDILFENNKIKNIPIVLGGSNTAYGQGLENVQFINNEIVVTDAEQTLNIRTTVPVNCEFKGNKIITNASTADIVNNDSYFQQWDRANNIWSKDPGAGNLGSGDTIDPDLEEDSGGDSGVPLAPSSLNATPITPSSITLVWNDNSIDETKFNIERSLNGNTFVPLFSPDADTIGYLDENLDPNTLYYYRINAENANGVSTWSNISLATTPALPSAPEAPTDLTAVVMSNSSVNLSWRDNSDDEIGFNIERSLIAAPARNGGGDGFVHIATVDPNIIGYLDRDLQPGTMYYYRVNAENTVGVSAWTSEVTAETDPWVNPGPEVVPNLGAEPKKAIVYVFDTYMDLIGIIDNYYSLIWAERYSEAGDFEMDLPIYYLDSEILKGGNFLMTNTSEVIMVIQGKKSSTTPEKDSLLVTGESAEGLLRKRFTQEHENVDEPADYLMKKKVLNSTSNPTDPLRKIDIFADPVLSSTIDKRYVNQLIEFQTVYDLFVMVCLDTNLGFKVRKQLVGNSTQLAFSPYEGVDRSYEQSILPRVVFSKEFDNILSGSYFMSNKNEVSLVFVVTEDAVHKVIPVWLGMDDSVPEPTDLDRVELVLETRIEREIEGSDPLTDDEVLAIIKTRGREAIYNNKQHGIFDGDFDINGNFKYGIDFFMGDIVQVYLYGKSVPARVIELVRSYSGEGIKTYIAVDYIF